MMQKIPCRSKKLKADHFLKCSNQDCDTAMFWSDKTRGYELPYSSRAESNRNGNSAIAPPATPTSKSTDTTLNTTQHPCPVCGKPLELYEYIKDGSAKQMLRCSDAAARRQNHHKKVAYFAAKGGFWSPTYGEIGQPNRTKKAASFKRKYK